MWPYLVIGAIGALWANSRAPSTKVEKSKAYGPKTGIQWDTELLPELGVLVVHKAGARVVFERRPEGLKAVKAGGDPKIVALIRKDFDG